MFYIASENGTYANFGGASINEISILSNSGGTWEITNLFALSVSDISMLVETLCGYTNSEPGRLDTGGYVGSSSTGLMVTPFVEINCDKIVVYGFSGKVVSVAAFYDGDRNPISTIHGVDNNHRFLSIDVPEGAVYVRATGEEGKCILIADGLSSIREYMYNVQSGEVDFSNAHLIDKGVISAATGNYSSSGSTTAATRNYLRCVGASRILVSLPTNVTRPTYGLAFYGKNKNFISSIPRPLTNSISALTAYIDVPADAWYFRTTYWNAANRQTYGEFYCKVLYNETLRSVNLDYRDLSVNSMISPTTGDSSDSSLQGATGYVYCHRASEIYLRMTEGVGQGTSGLAFYDESKTFIMGYPRLEGPLDSVDTIIAVPQNAYYFRTSYYSYEYKRYGAFHCGFRIPVSEMGQYRPYQGGYINFRVYVNNAVPTWWSTDNTMQDSEDMKGSCGVLLLPETYTPTGKPTPLLMYCHGKSRNVTYTQWGLNNADFLAQKQRFADNGFAVFDVNGQRDNNGNAINTSGMPQAVSAYRKAFEYIIEHYNVEHDVHIVGSSMGGAMALNYCYTYSNVKALALIGAWTDIYNCSWLQNVRDPFVECLGFTGTEEYEESKVMGYDPGKRILTINGAETIPSFKCPVRLWIGSGDVNTMYGKFAINHFIPALVRGGNFATIRQIEGLGHEIVAGGSEIVDNEIALWLNRF